MINNVKVKGAVEVHIHNQEGELKSHFKKDNLVVNAGLSFLANRLLNDLTTVITHMALGSSNTAPQATQTDLSAILGVRKALDSSTLVTTNVTNDSIQYVCTFAAGEATGTVQEMGLFNALAGGSMLSRVTFGAQTKGPTDSMTVTWTITFT